jgi:hypothetical protein
MTLERPTFPPRAEKSAFRLVGGTDFTPAAETQAAPASNRSKRRGPYKQRQPVEYYQDGLPVIDRAGEEDNIFRSIAEHRAAAAHYDRCVEIEGEAEGKVSEHEYSHLQHNTKNAFDEMMMWARAVIIGRPTTRRGLIHQARYLTSQFSEHVGWDKGACQLMYLPDNINDRPWFAAFLRSLAAGLRKMAGELDAPKQGGGHD